MSNTKCSPLPWVADVSDEANIVVMRSNWCLDMGGGICHISSTGATGIADAEFICRAVNCHDELLAALEDCVESLSHIETRTSTRINPPTLESARAAIAKARA